MADIAVIFHWQPDQLDGCDLGRLMHWRALAVERAKLLGMVKAD